jgi:hypothetical protein
MFWILATSYLPNISVDKWTFTSALLCDLGVFLPLSGLSSIAGDVPLMVTISRLTTDSWFYMEAIYFDWYLISCCVSISMACYEEEGSVSCIKSARLDPISFEAYDCYSSGRASCDDGCCWGEFESRSVKYYVVRF